MYLSQHGLHKFDPEHTSELCITSSQAKTPKESSLLLAFYCQLTSSWTSPWNQALHNLVKSMPARMHAVTKAKGGNAKYLHQFNNFSEELSI